MTPAPLDSMNLQAIGVIHSSHRQAEGTPIQPVFAEHSHGFVEVFSSFVDGLQDLEGFERIWLIYRLHKAAAGPLRVIPFRDTTERGVFATRSPCRPNSFGISCVRLISIHENELHISDVDILDGTPLLDIKPYVPRFDAFPNSRAGWLDQDFTDRTRADSRFDPPR
ncbi:MAG: tRNA (N6-threonylcarbamoyladenosine(37)-N6)-methyltransferase TrmO [Kiritimatiellia bacterium]|nr:tRNA (N6-threonylcarbamoyladenosine(37)-N6)-methyltransferase TrmO [Kiritimatiellia bacterium]